MDVRESRVTYRAEQTSSSSGSTASSRCRSGGAVPRDAMAMFSKQYELDKREMQHLNEKLNEYISRNKSLDAEHRRLQAELNELKRKWGFDSTPIREQYDPQLAALRKQIDAISEKKANAELEAKRAECDTSSTKHEIDFLNQLITLDNNRSLKLSQQLENLKAEYEALNHRFTDKGEELQRNRHEVDLLKQSVTARKDEYDAEAKARVTAQNDLQTLEEHIAFMKAIHEEERNALSSLATFTFVDNHFYDTQLAYIINMIRSDFEKLSRERREQLEAYYKLKTDVFLQEAAAKKVAIVTDDPTRPGDLAALKVASDEERTAYLQLQKENADYALVLQQLEAQWEQVSRENRRKQDKRERDFSEFCGEIQRREREIATIVDNNVSVKFEINTYRRLLDLEYTREPIAPRPVTPPPVLKPSYSTEIQTMTIQKSATGPINIEHVDPVGDFIVVANSGATNSHQDLTGWTVRRRIDSQDEVTYGFPDDYTLRSQSRVRILGRTANRNSTGTGEVLIADNFNTWGVGGHMETWLFDAGGIQRAALKQSFMARE